MTGTLHFPGDVGSALSGLEWSEDGYSLRTPHDGDVDGDGRHIVVGGETVITFADSDVGEEYRERILAALTPSPCPGDGMRRALETIARMSMTPADFKVRAKEIARATLPSQQGAGK